MRVQGTVHVQYAVSLHCRLQFSSGTMKRSFARPNAPVNARDAYHTCAWGNSAEYNNRQPYLERGNGVDKDKSNSADPP